MATLISNASGNLTGAATFAAAETGALALVLNRNSNVLMPAAATSTSVTFTVTSAKVIDGVLLWVAQTAGSASTGTFKVDLQKGGVSQGTVTVNKTDLPQPTVSTSIGPTLFKLGSAATGDGGSNWTIVLTTTGTNTVNVVIASGSSFDWTRAFRTTTAATPAAADNLYIVGELTGAGTHNSITVTMDSTAATAYGNGAVNSTSVAGGGIHVSNYGTLTYGTTAGTNYLLRVNGDLMVYQFGTLNMGSSAASAGDLYWSSTKLLMGFTGANGSQAAPGMTDESSSVRGTASIIAGQAQISTAQSKFGGSSLLLDGGSDYIAFPDSNDWDFGTGPFTIEGFFRFVANTGNMILVTQWSGNFAFWREGGNLYLRTAGGDSGTYAWTPTVNQWYHLAVDRDASSVLRIYIDGVMVVKTTGFTSNMSGSVKPLVIGSLIEGGFSGYDFNGYVDEVRITAGVARYASDLGYTVPTAAFPRVAGGPASTAILEFQQASADGDFGLRCLDNSVVNITGQPRTAGKNIVKCKLTADVGVNLINTSSTTQGTNVAALGADGLSLLGLAYTDNASNTAHAYGAGNVGPANISANTVLTGSVWLARGSGTNNRYVRVQLGNSVSVISMTTGVYVDVDLQAGTIGSATAYGTGVATGASITPFGSGYVVKVTGSIFNGTLNNPALGVSACSASGTTTYVGNTTQCFLFDHMVLAVGTSIPSTLNVDTDTGWLSGDAVCVASTTRTATDCEIVPLNANASTSSFTSAVPPSSTHSGTAPTQAEIGLLTRNVKIRSTSNTLMSYVYCTALATVTASWAEFVYFGTNAVGKRGIEIDGGAITNPKSFTYCSLHDYDLGGLYCNMSIATSINLTASNNVFWLNNNSNPNGAFFISNSVTNNDWTFDSNLVMRLTSAGMSFSDVGGVCTNNTVVGALGGGFIWNESLGATVLALGSISNNTAHSGAGVGFSFSNSSGGYSGTVSNCTAWRHNNSGVSLNLINASDLWFVNLTLFGNPNSSQGNFSTVVNCDAVNIRGGLIAGDTGFAAAHGLVCGASLEIFNVSSVDMSGSGSIYAPHTTSDFFLSGSLSNMRGSVNNCKFGAPNLFGNTKTIWTPSSYLGFQKYNQTAGDHRTEMTFGQLRTDTSVFNTASPSMRMTPNSASNKLESAPLGKGLQVAVDNGNTITAKVWIRKDSTYTGAQPRLIVRANAAIGINSDTVLATASDATSAVYSTWDPATVTAVTLSGGNLVATSTGGATDHGCHVAAAAGQTTGKYYFEITVTTNGGGSDTGFGIGTTTSTYSGMGNGGGVVGDEAYIGSGNIWTNGSNSGWGLGGGGLANGTVAGVAVDLDNRKIWFRRSPSGDWNNNSSANPVTNANGIVIPAGTMVPFATFNTSGNVFTANFGASAFSGAVPFGFTSGWGTPAGGTGTATWVQLTGTTAAATDAGTCEFIVDCDGTAGFVNVDDWLFTSGTQTTSCDMSNWYNGLPISEPAPSAGGGGAYFSAGFV